MFSWWFLSLAMLMIITHPILVRTVDMASWEACAQVLADCEAPEHRSLALSLLLCSACHDKTLVWVDCKQQAFVSNSSMGWGILRSREDWFLFWKTPSIWLQGKQRAEVGSPVMLQLRRMRKHWPPAPMYSGLSPEALFPTPILSMSTDIHLKKWESGGGAHLLSI